MDQFNRTYFHQNLKSLYINLDYNSIRDLSPLKYLSGFTELVSLNITLWLNQLVNISSASYRLSKKL